MSRQREVIEIPARDASEHLSSTRPLRVAAYCRVSTSQEAQQNSYAAQVAYYMAKITSNPDWTLAGIFADEGITGTSAKKRPDFQRMIKACKNGKIDLILTKSISRFARNTLDCLTYVRQLQALNIPVIFESEHIDTSKMDSEMLLTMLGATSQAESEATSSRVKWGVRAAFREGRVSYQYAHWLGYRKSEDGVPEIIPEEAAIVKWIFEAYLEGKSPSAIKASLENKGIPTKSGKKEWSAGSIRGILRNEKYAGDVLLQKTYTTDPITKRQKKNTGELPQYLIKDAHPAIISHEMFELVQAEMDRRSEAGRKREQTASPFERSLPTSSSKYALSEFLYCGECNTLYRRCVWKKREKTRIVWRCRNRLDNGPKYCKQSPTIDESVLHKALTAAINCQLARPEFLLAPFRQDELIPYGAVTPSPAKSMPELYGSLSNLQEQIDTAITNLIMHYAEDQKWDGDTSEIRELLSQRAYYGEAVDILDLGKYAEEIDPSRFPLPFRLAEYNDTIARLVFSKIRVLDEKHLEIHFKGGAVVVQETG